MLILLLDGKIMQQNIKLLGKNEEWLINELMKRNVLSIADVLLACVDLNGNFYIDLKNQDPSVCDVLH